jgi:hypothetical protein
MTMTDDHPLWAGQDAAPTARDTTPTGRSSHLAGLVRNRPITGWARSRDGRTTKIHLACEQGRGPLALVFTAGHRGDSPQPPGWNGRPFTWPTYIAHAVPQAAAGPARTSSCWVTAATWATATWAPLRGADRRPVARRRREPRSARSVTATGIGSVLPERAAHALPLRRVGPRLGEGGLRDGEAE